FMGLRNVAPEFWSFLFLVSDRFSMSFNPRDLTQGGQVSFMRLKMFLQINNIISYYVIIFSALLMMAILFIRISLQNLMNGIIYY
ncbi:hypothetical protein, partial [Bacillus sp. AFS073361]|uniref:hypothetical protein n=1 Tax=Bacillus sp. AFS073361 TaxID=2033511 RepID=UPI001C551A14